MVEESDGIEDALEGQLRVLITAADRSLNASHAPAKTRYAEPEPAASTRRDPLDDLFSFLRHLQHFGHLL